MFQYTLYFVGSLLLFIKNLILAIQLAKLPFQTPYEVVGEHPQLAGKSMWKSRTHMKCEVKHMGIWEYGIYDWIGGAFMT